MNHILTMTGRGLITLPNALRKQLGLKENDQFQVELTTEGILLRPVVSVPVEIYTPERIAEFAAGEAELKTLIK